MGRDAGTIAAIKARLNLADVVRRYVDLRPAAGRFVGLCPFHQEKTPSFSVNAEQGFYYCFGCQATGDIFDFYARMNGLEFREALEALAEQAGVTLEGHAPDPREAQQKQLRKACMAMHELAQAWFRRCLASSAGKTARDYLTRRALSPAMVDGFGLGFAPEDWQGLHDLLRDKGFTPAQGLAAGLLSQSSNRVYDRFRGRLIFPIQDLAGRVIAFGGRVIGDGEPKYLNSSDTPIYTKGEHLYGLHQARPTLSKTRRALLTEGYVDVLSLVQHGFTEAVGVLGTALTEAQVKRLGGLVSEVVLVFDGDAAGQKAALRAAPMLLGQGLGCKVVLLPDGQDADDLLRKSGAEGFQALLATAGDGLDFCMASLRSSAAPKELLNWAKDFMRGLGDTGLKAYYLPRLAKGLGLAEAELRSLLAGLTPKGAGRPQPSAAVSPAGLPSGKVALAKAAIAEPGRKRDRDLLSFAIRHPDKRPELLRLELATALSHERARALWDKMNLHTDADIFSHLDEGERRFWAEASLQQPLEPEEADRWMSDIRQFLESASRRETEADIAGSLREAKARGDQAEVDRLFAALVTLRSRPDTGHEP